MRGKRNAFSTLIDEFLLVLGVGGKENLERPGRMGVHLILGWIFTPPSSRERLLRVARPFMAWVIVHYKTTCVALATPEVPSVEGRPSGLATRRRESTAVFPALKRRATIDQPLRGPIFHFHITQVKMIHTPMPKEEAAPRLATSTSSIHFQQLAGGPPVRGEKSLDVLHDADLDQLFFHLDRRRINQSA